MRKILNYRINFYLFLTYLKGKNQKLFSLNAKIAFWGLFLSNCLLIIIISVFDGLQIQLKKSIISVEPHITVHPADNHEKIHDYKKKIKTIKNQLKENIVNIEPKIHSPGLLRTNNNVVHTFISSYVIFDSKNNLSKNIPKITYMESSFNKNKFYCFLGEELSLNLNIQLGDFIELIVPSGQFSFTTGLTPNIRKFKVVGLFKTQHYQYDSQMVVVPFKQAQNLFQIPKNQTQKIAIKIKNIDELNKQANQTLLALNKNKNKFYLSTIKNTQRTFFSALQLERTIMAIILFLFIFLAILGVVFTLYNTIRVHKKDIGILKAIGLSNLDILHIFTIFGFSIGIAGTFLGILFGMFCATHLNTFIVLLEKWINLIYSSFLVSNEGFFKPIELIPKGVYYFEKIPYYFDLSLIYLISFLSIFLSGLGSFLPAYYASRLEPMEIIRGASKE